MCGLQYDLHNLSSIDLFEQLGFDIWDQLPTYFLHAGCAVMHSGMSN